MKTVRFVLCSLFVFLIPGCSGGGGKESTAPDSVKFPKGTLTAQDSCSVPNGKAKCVITLKAMTSDTTSAEVVDDQGVRYPVTPNVEDTVDVALAVGEKRRFTLSYGGASTTDPVLAEAKCASGTWIDDSATPMCRSSLRYTDVIYAEGDNNPTPIRFRGDTCATMAIEPAKDNTGYVVPVGAIALTFRAIYKEPLPSGRILMSASVPEGIEAVRRPLVLNPLANTVEVYQGDEGPSPPLESLADIYPQGGWVDITQAYHIERPDDPTSGSESTAIGKYTETATLMVYTKAYDKAQIYYCRDKATGVETVLIDDPAVSWPKAIVKYSN